MDINRRAMLSSVAMAVVAFPLASCDPPDVTLAAIIAAIQQGCGFVVTWEAVVPVIISLLSTFNAAAGAAATVADALAKQVEMMVCDAVMAKLAQVGAAAEAGTNITVIVNGVSVTGHMAAKPSVKFNG